MSWAGSVVGSDPGWGVMGITGPSAETFIGAVLEDMTTRDPSGAIIQHWAGPLFSPPRPPLIWPEGMQAPAPGDTPFAPGYVWTPLPPPPTPTPTEVTPVGYLDDLSFAGPAQDYLASWGSALSFAAPAPAPTPYPDYLGSGPGFDIWDIPDFLSRLDLPLGGSGPVQQPAPAPAPGPIQYVETAPGTELPPDFEVGPGPPVAPVGPGALERHPTIRRGMYIGGALGGLWHTTPRHIHYDKHTGIPREVGGNRTPNRTTLAQDPESGDLQFYAPVESTGWRFKYRARRKTHTHKRVTHAHARRRAPARRKHHHHGSGAPARHRHSYRGMTGLTAKQLAAGFGGKRRMGHHHH